MQLFHGSWHRCTVVSLAILGCLYGINFFIVPSLSNLQQWAQQQLPNLIIISPVPAPAAANVSLLLNFGKEDQKTTSILKDAQSRLKEEFQKTNVSSSSSRQKGEGKEKRTKEGVLQEDAETVVKREGRQEGETTAQQDQQSLLRERIQTGNLNTSSSRQKGEEKKKRTKEDVLQGDAATVVKQKGRQEGVIKTFQDEQLLPRKGKQFRNESRSSSRQESDGKKEGSGAHKKKKNAGVVLAPSSSTSSSMSFKFRNASWVPEVGAWLSHCAYDPPIRITERFSGNSCANKCSRHGVCNHDLGECRCFHGYTGVACELERDFECNIKQAPEKELKHGRFGPWIPSMCPATCDKRKGFCYCGEGTKYPRRPVAEQCGFPKIAGTDWKFDWTRADLDIFSNSSAKYGWCNLDPAEFYAKTVQKKKDCYCTYEGAWGFLCENTTQHSCYNQCSGNGECRGGFCACGEGWHGIDCSVFSPVSLMTTWPTWLSQGVVHISTSLEVGSQPSTEITVERHRPLIYVYDLPPEFNSLLMEGRHFKFHCVNRIYDAENSTFWTNQLYGVEIALLESLLASEHRTTNAEEADFFYVPVLGACATARAGEAPHMDREKEYLGLRTYFSGDLYRQAYQHIKTNYPYWDRSDGRDHVWLFPWDEGACVSPKEIWNSMMLVHWGNANSKYNYSTTGYPFDNWDMIPTNWRGNHPCYDPVKDLVLPAWKDPDPYLPNMRMWTRQQEQRPVLFYFRGNLGRKYEGGRPEAKYSMGIRQRLGEEFGTEPNLEGHVGQQSTIDVKVFSAKDENYSRELASSRFCGVLPGDGWSGRIEDSILHGCIPVIIQDGIHLPYENVLDYSEFAVRIAEDDLPQMVAILRSIPDKKIKRMQYSIQNLWQRFTYHNSVQLEAHRQEVIGRQQRGDRFRPANWASEYTKLTDDDAFATFIQVLQYKLGQQPWRATSKQAAHASNADCRNYSYQNQ